MDHSGSQCQSLESVLQLDLTQDNRGAQIAEMSFVIFCREWLAAVSWSLLSIQYCRDQCESSKGKKFLCYHHHGLRRSPSKCNDFFPIHSQDCVVWNKYQIYRYESEGSTCLLDVILLQLIILPVVLESIL